MNLKLKGKFEVIEILKPTKRKLICDMKAGDVFEIESALERQYSFGGRIGAVWLSLIYEGKKYNYSYTELASILEILNIKQYE